MFIEQVFIEITIFCSRKKYVAFSAFFKIKISFVKYMLLLYTYTLKQEVHNELQDMEPVIARLQSDGSHLMRKSQDPASSNIKQNMQLLQQTWEHVKTRSADRKVKYIYNYITL